MIQSEPVNRRDLFHSAFSGLGATALLALLGRAARLGAEPLPGTTNLHPPKAKRAIQISLVGGLSHLDSFDYKPQLVRRHGEALPGKNLITFQGEQALDYHEYLLNDSYSIFLKITKSMVRVILLKHTF